MLFSTVRKDALKEKLPENSVLVDWLTHLVHFPAVQSGQSRGYFWLRSCLLTCATGGVTIGRCCSRIC
jgi:hypothetical protein